MKFLIQKLFIAVILMSSSMSSAFAVVDYHVENQPKFIEKVSQIAQKGVLKQKSNGYLYVSVSRDFISEGIPLIEAVSKILPSFDYTNKNGIGPHISVIYETEMTNGIWKINELNKEFNFSIIELRTVPLKQDKSIKKLWLLAVAAPELERLRESYGLSAKLKGHDYHITIGTQSYAVYQMFNGELHLEETDCEEPEFEEAA